MIRRFDIELINISEKIKELTASKKRFRGLKPTNSEFYRKKKIRSRKKVSKIKKCMSLIQSLEESKTELMNLEK